jgi:hypothetical protein
VHLSLGTPNRGRAARRVVLGAVVVLAFGTGGTAWAYQPLAPGVQVNDDPAAGINPALNVSGELPDNSDVVGGALAAGGLQVPWAVFRQMENGAAVDPFDQIFVRSFANGAWTTRGAGTFGGRSSALPTFSGSLNFDQGQDGEAPSIDFAGAGRTVPWATWYEDTTGFNTENIFASRFDNTGDANQGKWIFGGQGRGLAGGTVPVPSLNINTGQAAEDPSVAGGSATNPLAPGPWVTWEETSTAGTNTDQIFVSRPEGPGMANCDGVTPLGVVDITSGHVPAIGGFCWQQTGVPRFGTPTLDPSLNVDPTRDADDPDIAFTGANDAVPWVVWSESGTSGANGLLSTGLVFAAKGIADGVSANGGFHWVAVGTHAQQELDTTGAVNGFGGCAESASVEGACSLNTNPANNAENARVAAGTMTPGTATVPWVAWQEDVGGVDRIFVSRLVGGAAGQFVTANQGNPISPATGDAGRPDITFSGNTPYVSWRQQVGGGLVDNFHGHFTNAADPTFVADESDVQVTPDAQANVREPISSTCTATPFSADGTTCPAGAAGTPFFLFTSGAGHLSLLADAYDADTPVTGTPTAITTTGATLNGSVNPEGAAVHVSFQFGATTAYGQSTAAQLIGPLSTATPFTATLGSLAPATTVHYRAVATSDFGTFVGADQTLTTSPASKPPPPAPSRDGRASISKVKHKGTKITLHASCQGSAGQTCKLVLRLTVKETRRGHKTIAIAARKVKVTHKIVGLGGAHVTIAASAQKTVTFGLNRLGKHLLAARHRLKVQLTGSQSLSGAKPKTVLARKVVFVAHRHAKKH